MSATWTERYDEREPDEEIDQDLHDWRDRGNPDAKVYGAHDWRS